MDKLVFSEKLNRATGFAVKTIGNIAIATFAAKVTLLYGAAVVKEAKHILATNGKVWNPSTYIPFNK